MENHSSMCVRVLFAVLICSQLPVRAQQCGIQPGPFTYSENFYRAEAKFLDASSSTSVKATIPIEDLPISGSLDAKQQITNWQTLTIQEARTYVQQEHSTREAQILAECGYRLCLLANSPGVVSASAATVYAEVCSQALVPSESARSDISVRPKADSVIFSSTATQNRSVTVTNGSPGMIKVRSTVAPGPMGGDLITNNTCRGEFTIDPNKSKSCTVTLHKPSDGQVANPELLFELVDTSGGHTVVTRTVYALYADPALLLPPPQIPLGQFWPNARIRLDIKSDASPFRAEHIGPYPMPRNPLDGPNMANPNPGYGTAAAAKYQANITIPTPTSTHASFVLNIQSNTGGTCGYGSFGGEGSVSPRWEDILSLPGLPNRQVWKIDLKTDVAYRYYFGGGPATCFVSVGPNVNPISASAQSQGTLTMNPGSYVVVFSCTAPNPIVGCYGHANGVNEQYLDSHFILNFDATRTNGSLKDVPDPLKTAPVVPAEPLFSPQ
jgi:hypothetical protein